MFKNKNNLKKSFIDASAFRIVYAAALKNIHSYTNYHPSCIYIYTMLVCECFLYHMMMKFEDIVQCFYVHAVLKV